MTRSAWVAGGLSVCLHATALLAFRGERPTPVRAETSRAPVELEVLRLTALVPSAHASAVSAATPPAPAPKPVRVAPSPVGAALTARVAAAVAPEPAPAQAGALPVESEPAAAASPSGDGANAAAGPSSTLSATDALDTAALSRRLQEGALHCYPAAASRFRQSGVAQVSFCLDGAGALRETTVETSSGSALLDRAATDCVVPAAAPFEPRTFGRCFTVPVRCRQ